MSQTHSLKERIGMISDLIEKLDQGKLTQEELDTLVLSTRELYERSVILQYKAFEKKIFGETVEQEHTEREEVAEILHEDTTTEEPEIEPEIVREEQPAFDFSLFDEPASEPEIEHHAPEPVVEEHVSVSHAVKEEGPVVEETVTVEKTAVSVDNDALSSVMSLLNRELEKHTAGHLMPKLDTLIGSFGLNERLQFINELFRGSSEDFAIAVSEFDGAGSYSDALAQFAQLSLQRGWSADNETVLDFLTKVKRRYA